MNAMMPLLKRAILIATILFLTSFTLPAANRSTCPTFGSRAVDAISQTVSIPNRCQQIGIAFHYEITVIYIPTHHSSLITHHGPQGHDYTYTGNNLLETYADTAGRIAKYTYGNALISKSNATGDTHSVITDYQNSVSASVSASGGALTLFAYSPFGKVRYRSSNDNPQTLGWLSRQFDSETGNNYLINRYYNADRGSFLSPDRYQYVQTTTPFTFNLYQYGYANPLVNVDPEGLKILSGDPLFNVIDQYEPQLSLLDRAMIYYDLQQTYDYKGEGLFESYNPFLTRQAPVDANVRAYMTDSNGYYYAYKVMNLKEGQREPTLRYVPLNVGDSTVGKHFAFNSSFLEGLQWKGHVRSQAGRYQQNEHDWGNLSGKLTNIALNFAAVMDTGLGLNKAAAAKLAQAERATAKVRLLNHLEESRLIRAARMRVASYAETDAPVIKLVASDSAGNLVQVGERTIIEKGQFVNRMFDSRAGQAGAHVSGPLGRSFSPGSGIPTTASEGIQQRGLNIFYPNNAQEAIIYRATESIPAIQRPSIGGTVPEILIEPQYWDKLEVVRQFSVKP